MYRKKAFKTVAGIGEVSIAYGYATT